jgi:hypothetical protein
VAASVAALAGPLAHAGDADVPALKQQVQDLQRQIETIEKRQAAAGPVQSSPGAAPSRQADSAPSFYAGPVKVTLNGFVELMAINRNRNEAADWASNSMCTSAGCARRSMIRTRAHSSGRNAG